MSVVGWWHTIFASAALFFGAAVTLRRKGTRSHQWLGRAYATCMGGTLVSSFLIYDLFGRFGVFHWAALVSALTLGAGLAAVLTRRPRQGWMQVHLNFMSYSYLGLLAAAASEASVRLPIVPVVARLLGITVSLAFGLCVGVPTLLVFAVGSVLIARRTRLSFVLPNAQLSANVAPSGASVGLSK